MNIELIKLFGCALSDEPCLEFAKVNKEAMQRGYLVHPDVCNNSVLDFLKSQTIDYNATFYKRWQDVIDKSREELLFDQLLHYMSTYGTDYSMGQGYVPNNQDNRTEIECLPYQEYKMILPITKTELAGKCMDLLKAGIALKQTTMQVCADYIIQVLRKEEIEIDKIKNREAQIYLCDKLGVAPNEKFSLFRYIIFKTTDSTLVIKNKSMFERIMRSDNPFDLTTLSDEQIVALSSIFYRFKPLFLAFKKRIKYNQLLKMPVVEIATKNAKMVNRIRRMAVKNHIPMDSQLIQHILIPADKNKIKELLPNISLFKVVALMQVCKERIVELDQAEIDRLFVIRNQKLWLRHYDNLRGKDREYLNDLYDLLENYLIEKLRKKACVTLFAKDYSLALPSSEKSFIGQMPYGTKYHLGEHNYIGIYWRNEWGTKDFDLSVVNINGSKIGWNADFYDENQDVIFSGDMTNADPEASEVLYFRKKATDAMIYVNRYNGEQGSKYKMYFGAEEIKDFSKNYMVDPSSIKLTVDMESGDDSQQAVGLIFDGTVTLMQFMMGRGRVASNRTELIDCMRRKALSFVEVEPILRKAGFREPKLITHEDGSKEWEKADLDLTNLSKDSLIKLLSE